MLVQIRSAAGALLTGVFLLAGQLAPLAHLAFHRNDHTHGPVSAEDSDHDHDHEYDHDHDHDAPPHSGQDGATPSSPVPPDHGRDSIAHLGLALIPGPLPPHISPPGETLAPPLDVVVRWHHAPRLLPPPARGPPRPH